MTQFLELDDENDAEHALLAGALPTFGHCASYVFFEPFINPVA
jgi:hypothetical protein